jgi:hypothetical protein
MNRLHGYHTKAGPLYQHVEDLYFRVQLNGAPKSLVSDFAKYFDLKKRHFKKRLWVTMRHQRLKRLRGRGDQVVLRRVDGQYSISYRTRSPGRARKELGLPIGPRKQLPIAVVLYRPENTQTPHRVKLELKAPSSGRRVQVTEVARNRLVGLLRYLLSSALITAVTKPKKSAGEDATWAGVQFKDQYKLGKNEKRVRFQF